MFSLFKKKSNLEVPAWANFFTPEEYSAFIKALENYVRSRNTELKIEDNMIYLPDENGEAGQFGLINVSQVCN